MITKAIIEVFFFLIRMILTPIGALLNVAGINDVIAQVNEYLQNLLSYVGGAGASLAAYFFDWSVIQMVFGAWLIIEGAEKAYAIYRFIRKNTI